MTSWYGTLSSDPAGLVWSAPSLHVLVLLAGLVGGFLTR